MDLSTSSSPADEPKGGGGNRGGRGRGRGRGGRMGYNNNRPQGLRGSHQFQQQARNKPMPLFPQSPPTKNNKPSLLGIPPGFAFETQQNSNKWKHASSSPFTLAQRLRKRANNNQQQRNNPFVMGSSSLVDRRRRNQSPMNAAKGSVWLRLGEEPQGGRVRRRTTSSSSTEGGQLVAKRFEEFRMKWEETKQKEEKEQQQTAGVEGRRDFRNNDESSKTRTGKNPFLFEPKNKDTTIERVAIQRDVNIDLDTETLDGTRVRRIQLDSLGDQGKRGLGRPNKRPSLSPRPRLGRIPKLPVVKTEDDVRISRDPNPWIEDRDVIPVIDGLPPSYRSQQKKLSSPPNSYQKTIISPQRNEPGKAINRSSETGAKSCNTAILGKQQGPNTQNNYNYKGRQLLRQTPTKACNRSGINYNTVLLKNSCLVEDPDKKVKFASPLELAYPFVSSLIPELHHYSWDAKRQSDLHFSWMNKTDSILNPLLPGIPRIKKPTLENLLLQTKSANQIVPDGTEQSRGGLMISESQQNAEISSVTPSFFGGTTCDIPETNPSSDESNSEDEGKEMSSSKRKLSH